MLGLLIHLALREQGGGYHHLHLLHFLEVAGPEGAHRGADAAQQVLGAVIKAGRSPQDLLEAAGGAHLDAGAAGQHRTWGGHAPVEAAARGLAGPRDRRADHHGIGAAGQALADVAPGHDAAVGDDRHVAAALVEVVVAGGGAVGHGGGLGNADTQHAAAGAGRTGADAHHHAGGTGPHQLQGHLVGDAVADHHRHAEIAAEGLEIEAGLSLGADVLGAHHRGLHEEDLGTGLGDRLTKLHGRHRGGTHRRDAAAGLDLGNPLADEILPDRLAVELLHQRHELLLAHRRDPVQDRVGVVVAALHPLKVQHPQGSLAGEFHAHPHIHHAIHGAGDDRDLPLDAPQGPAAVGDGGIDGAPPRHQGDLIDAVGTTHGSGSAQLDGHRQVERNRHKLSTGLAHPLSGGP